VINIVSKFSLPAAVSEESLRLGQRVRVARLRRGWSVAELAEKVGVNRNTITALEHGKPGTSFGVWLSTLWALGLEGTLADVAAPDADLHGKALEAAQRRKRAGKRRVARDDYDF